MLQARFQGSAIAKAAGGVPTPEQMGAINALALVELKDSDVYVRTFYVAHNGIDRDLEVLDDTLLDDLARTLPGKGLFVRHPGGWDGDSGPGEGRWFAAKVVSMTPDKAREVLREPGLRFAPGTDTAKILEASAYIVHTPENKTLTLKIDGGVAGDVSIGFRANDRTGIKDGDGNTIAQRLHAPGEAYEASLVWLGAQPGARAYKGAQPINPDGDLTMDTKQLETQLATANTKLADLTPKASRYEAIVKEIGGELADDPAQLGARVKEAQAFRKALVENIVRLERLAGVTKGDDKAAVDAATKVYEGLPIEKLQALEGRMKAIAPKGAEPKVTGGDPNASGADDPAVQKPTSEQKASSPLHNPLVGGAPAAA